VLFDGNAAQSTVAWKSYRLVITDPLTSVEENELADESSGNLFERSDTAITDRIVRATLGA
jgi:hypothetical protein